MCICAYCTISNRTRICVFLVTWDGIGLDCFRASLACCVVLVLLVFVTALMSMHLLIVLEMAVGCPLQFSIVPLLLLTDLFIELFFSKLGQLAKYTSAMFAEMPHCEKVMWHMRAKEDKARYIKQIAEYKPSPGYDAKGDITEAGAILYGISLKTNSRSKTSANNVALAQANGKPRPKKDKNAPKRNLSAFLLYQNYMRHVFNKNPNSNSSFGDIATYSSQTFKTLSVEEKAYWTQMAEEDKARYEKEAAMYNPPPGYDRFGHLREHANGSSTADAAASSGADGSKKKRRKKRSPRDTTAPKRSSGAYVFFTNEFRPQIWGAQPDLKFVELGRVLGAKWRALTPKEKMPYEALANQDKARYQSEMQEYNRKKLDRERAERRVLDAEQDTGGVNVNVNVGNLEDEGMSKIPPSLPVSMPDVGMNLNMGMNMGMNMNIPAIPPIPPPSATSPAAAHAHAHNHGFSPLHVHDVNVNVNDIHQQHEEHPPINDASAHAHVPSPPAHGFGVDVGVAVGSPSPVTAVEGTDTELNLKREAAASPNGSFYAA